MPKRSNEFQRLLLLIQHALAGNATVRESGLLRDRITGQEREVDILIEGRAAIYPVIVSVECIAQRRKATVEWVERMWGKHQNLATNQLVLVAKQGFTREAENKAHALGIRIATMEHALTTDWVSTISHIEALEFTTIDTRVSWVRGIFEEGVFTNGVHERQQIFRESGEILGTIQQMVDNIEHDKSLWESVSEAVKRALESENIVGTIGTMELIHTLELPEDCYMTDEFGIRGWVACLQIGIAVTWSSAPVHLEFGKLEGVQVAHGVSTHDLHPAKIALVERKGQQYTAVIGWLNKEGDVYEVAMGSPEPEDTAKHRE